MWLENDKDKVWSRASVLCSYCQLVEVQEVSGGREGLVELSDLSHQDRVLQTSLQSKLIDKCLIQQVLIHSL